MMKRLLFLIIHKMFGLRKMAHVEQITIEFDDNLELSISEEGRLEITINGDRTMYLTKSQLNILINKLLVILSYVTKD